MGRRTVAGLLVTSGIAPPAVDVIRGSGKATRPEVVIMEFVLLLLLVVGWALSSLTP